MSENLGSHFHINVVQVDLGRIRKNLEQGLLSEGRPRDNLLIFSTFFNKAGQSCDRLGLVFLFQKCLGLDKQIPQFLSRRNSLDNLGKTVERHVADFSAHFLGLFFKDGNYFFFKSLAQVICTPLVQVQVDAKVTAHLMKVDRRLILLQTFNQIAVQSISRQFFFLKLDFALSSERSAYLLNEHHQLELIHFFELTLLDFGGQVADINIAPAPLRAISISISTSLEIIPISTSFPSYFSFRHCFYRLTSLRFTASATLVITCGRAEEAHCVNLRIRCL